MQKLIQLKNVTYKIPYGETILENINLEIAEGEFMGVLGHNGTGKTTLLDILMGLKQVKGDISILGENPHQLERKKKGKVIFLSQDVAIKGNLTIDQFLNFHSSFYSDYSKTDEENLLKVFDLKRNMKVGALSTGQQKKVQIIAGLSTQPKIILIDEITAVLDPETREIFFHELEIARVKNNTSIILATNIAEDLIDRVHKVFFIDHKKGVIHDPQKILSLFHIGRAA